MNDPHKVLGVRKNASAQSIRKAYRRLAMNYHPDRNSSDPVAVRKYHEVQEAYAELTGKSSKPDTSAEAAHAVLTELLASVMSDFFNKKQDPAHHDVLASMRAALSNVLTNIRQTIKQHQEAKAAMAALSGRFRGGHAEALEAIVAFHCTTIDTQVASLNEKITYMEKAQAMLRDTSYRFEPPPNRTMTVGGRAPTALWTLFGGQF